MQIIAKQLLYLNTNLRAICRIWCCWLHMGAADLGISDVYLCPASLLSVYSTYWFLWFFPSWSLLYTLNWATSSAMKPIPESPSALFLHYWMFWLVVVRQKHEEFTNEDISWSKACPLMTTRHPWATPLFFSVTSIYTASSICTFCVWGLICQSVLAWKIYQWDYCQTSFSKGGQCWRLDIKVGGFLIQCNMAISVSLDSWNDSIFSWNGALLPRQSAWLNLWKLPFCMWLKLL